MEKGRAGKCRSPKVSSEERPLSLLCDRPGQFGNRGELWDSTSASRGLRLLPGMLPRAPLSSPCPAPHENKQIERVMSICNVFTAVHVQVLILTLAVSFQKQVRIGPTMTPTEVVVSTATLLGLLRAHAPSSCLLRGVGKNPLRGDGGGFRREVPRVRALLTEQHPTRRRVPSRGLGEHEEPEAPWGTS